jgi:hypothetical protein
MECILFDIIKNNYKKKGYFFTSILRFLIPIMDPIEMATMNIIMRALFLAAKLPKW